MISEYFSKIPFVLKGEAEVEGVRGVKALEKAVMMQFWQFGNTGSLEYN